MPAFRERPAAMRAHVQEYAPRASRGRLGLDADLDATAPRLRGAAGSGETGTTGVWAYFEGGRGRGVAAVAFLLVVGACGATASSPARPIVDGGADANGSSTATCDGDAGVCEESPSCCIITADSVNLADNCAGPKPMVLNCQPTKCGAVNLATGCYQRSSGDGGIETYSTSTLWSPTVLGPGFVTCPASVQSQVEQINKTCP
jgi:hypothetical protein